MRTKIAAAVAACLILAMSMTSIPANAATTNSGGGNGLSAAMTAAEKASPKGDKAALDAAKAFTAAALLYCQDSYTYYTTNFYTYVPQYEDATRATQRCYLERGTSGLGVQVLQRSLNQCYGKGLTVDGAFGNATYNALLQVQRQIGVTVDGVYGPGTGTAMLHGGDACRRVPAAIFS